MPPGPAPLATPRGVSGAEATWFTSPRAPAAAQSPWALDGEGDWQDSDESESSDDSDDSQSTEDTESADEDRPGWQTGPPWQASSARLLGAAAGELGAGLGAAMRSPRMDFSEPPLASKEAPPTDGLEVTFQTVTFDRSRGDKLGIEVNHADGVTLFIEEVTPGGLCEAWNIQHPDQVVRRRDRIVATNGISGNALHMMEELMKAGLHTVTICRKLRASRTPRGPAWASTSFSLQTPRGNFAKVQTIEGRGLPPGTAAAAAKLGLDEEDDAASRSTSSVDSGGHSSPVARLSIPSRGLEDATPRGGPDAPREHGWLPPANQRAPPAVPAALSPRGTPRAGVSGSLQQAPRLAGCATPRQWVASARGASASHAAPHGADPEGAPGERLRDGLAPLSPFSAPSGGGGGGFPREPPDYQRRLPAVVGVQRSWTAPAILFPELELVDVPLPSG